MTMPLPGDVVFICKAIGTTVSRILDVKETYFFASDEFWTDLDSIRSSIHSYEELYGIQGRSAPESVVMVLKKAQVRLRRVEARLHDLQANENEDRRCSSGCWLYSKFYITVFPDKLEKAVKRVSDELEKVPQIVRDEADLPTFVRHSTNFQPIPTRMYNNDNLYVPIEQSQTGVLTAMESFDGPRIILLYGGVGKGKSTLARYVCELYGKHGERRDTFKFVLFVECGGASKLDPSNAQYEILKRLSPVSLSISPENEKLDFKERIAESLYDFLSSGKKILIILDDVSNASLISEMWKASKDGTQVKYLVTSQYANLCDSFKSDSVSIAMGDPTADEAKKILASLVGLEDKVIPDNLQGTADKMIEATQGNPLALACLASNFAYSRNKTSVDAWKETYKALRKLLDRPETTIVLGGNPETPPRSLWAAMKICIDSLESGDAKSILFLMYACEQESVPKQVLRIWHSTSTTSSGIFFRSIDELCSRELLQESSKTIESQINIDNLKTGWQKPATWSLLTTVKLYIEQQMAGEEEMRSLFGALLGNKKIESESTAKHEGDSETEVMENENTKVAIALCALYFDSHHSDKVVARTATQACAACNIDWNATIKDRKRKAIEPLLWLLDQPEEDDLTWTASNINCVRQVFLKYTCDRELDDENICLLLQLTRYPSAPLATVIALSNIFMIEGTSLLKHDRLTFLTPLVHLMSTTLGVAPAIRKAASAALEIISWDSVEQSTSIVESTPHILPTLVACLQEALASNIPGSIAAAKYAGGTLWNLTCFAEPSIRTQLLNEDGLLAALVKCLSQDANRVLQENAAGALSNLGIDSESAKLRIVNEAGALRGLVAGLSSDHSPKLQKLAAASLKNLAFGGESIRLRILNEDGALAAFVRSLSKDGNPKLQETVASIFAFLAAGGEAAELRIMNEAGVLAGLVAALSKDRNPKVQAMAAEVFLNLASGGESIKLRILNEDGALAAIVRSLSKEENRELQEKAAWAFTILAAGGETTKQRIVNEGGVLAGLVAALSNDHNPILQELAAGVFVTLASGGDSVKLRILNEHGALAGIVRALSKDDNPELQENAAWAFTILAAGDKLAKLRIVNEVGALAGLVATLLKDQNLKLQALAGLAFLNLASGEEFIKLRILNEDGALAAIVSSLSKEDNPELQEMAGAAFTILTAGDE